jgi:hypothetical protein
MKTDPVPDCPKCGTPREENNTDCCDDYEMAELRARPEDQLD